MYKYKYTIYTPCYNSGKYIHRVFKSLENQTFRDFELIIINDGSNDDSGEIISEYIKDVKYPVNYINLEKNIGFNKSMNLAVKEAKGEFFLIAHSDDEFVSNALEVMLKYWEEADEQLKEESQGVKCNCLDQYGNLIGDYFPASPFVSDMFELNFKYKIKGEKWGFIKTDILKEFPFPEEVKFVPEGLIWYKISAKYKSIFINECLRIYHVDNNPNSLMKRASGKANFCYGKRILEKEFINLLDNKMAKYPLSFIKVIIRYIGYSNLCRLNLRGTLKDIIKLKYKILIIFLYPLGIIYSKA